MIYDVLTGEISDGKYYNTERLSDDDIHYRKELTQGDFNLAGSRGWRVISVCWINGKIMKALVEKDN